MDPSARRLTQAVSRAFRFVARHWLAIANAVMALFVGPAFLAPWLMLHGYTGPGRLLYLAYQPFCHQYPERSFFLGGERPWYTYGELAQRLGSDVPARYIGNPELGYKVAFCERDTAIYAGMLLAGLAFALLRHRMKRLPWRTIALLVLASTAPMAIDGLVQLVGILESDWLRRTVTGLLFGSAVIWLLPWVEWGMNDAQEAALRLPEEADADHR